MELRMSLARVSSSHDPLIICPTSVIISCSWTYQTEEELDGSGHWGLISSYGGGGFVQDLALNREASLAIISELKQNLWIDRGTRVVFVDFTVYNANINLFCVVR